MTPDLIRGNLGEKGEGLWQIDLGSFAAWSKSLALKPLTPPS